MISSPTPHLFLFVTWQQMLRYEEGEYYQTHHDYIPHQKQRQSGVRILTVYMYLNDLGEDQGGGTQFTNLNLTVQPKKGAALLWPSVLDQSPHDKDERTMHQALPVKNGAVKYGANAVSTFYVLCMSKIYSPHDE